MVKLPHWAQMALALAGVVVVWFMQQNANGSLVLPAAVVTGLTILNTVIGLFSNAVGKSVPQVSK